MKTPQKYNATGKRCEQRGNHLKGFSGSAGTVRGVDSPLKLKYGNKTNYLWQQLASLLPHLHSKIVKTNSPPLFCQLILFSTEESETEIIRTQHPNMFLINRE